MAAESEILEFLSARRIHFSRFEHHPTATMEEAEARTGVHGELTKNILLKAKGEQRYFLVVTTPRIRLDMASLQASLGVRKLSFASAEDLGRLLGVAPGSVTLLGLVNDVERVVSLVVDAVLWNAPETQHHPLVNTSTVVISRDGLRRFLDCAGHEATVIDFSGAG